MRPSDTLKDWLGTFRMIFISPTPKMFVAESEKAANKFASAMGWLAFIALYSYFFAFLEGSFLGVAGLVYDFIVIPLMVVLASSAAHFMLQRVFHKKQYHYDKLVYVYTAVFVSIQLIFIPIFVFLPDTIAKSISSVMWGYQFVLLVIAVKGISNMEYWQSVTIVLVSVLAGFIVLLCAIPFLVSMLGGVSRTIR